MTEGGETDSRNLKIKYFAAGALIGGLGGLLVGNMILGSCIGMAAGVTLGNSALEHRD